jgi:uncharacterized protein YecE (DUF72 family)
LRPTIDFVTPPVVDPQQFHIGSMGFGYADWKGHFYPKRLPQSQWLSHYADCFDAIELDTTFHAVPPVERVIKWKQATPDGFRFSVKTPKAITHESTPVEAVTPMRNFLATMKHLGHKLDTVLIQYPPSMSASAWPEIRKLLASLPPGVCDFAIEFRHASWFTRGDVLRDLRAMSISLVWAEYERRPTAPPPMTSDRLYIRLIGVHERYVPVNFLRWDPQASLEWWQSHIDRAKPCKCWVLLNNDYAGYSIPAMNAFRKLVGQEVREPPQELTLF